MTSHQITPHHISSHCMMAATKINHFSQQIIFPTRHKEEREVFVCMNSPIISNNGIFLNIRQCATGQAIGTRFRIKYWKAWCQPLRAPTALYSTFSLISIFTSLIILFRDFCPIGQKKISVNKHEEDLRKSSKCADYDEGYRTIDSPSGKQ